MKQIDIQRHWDQDKQNGNSRLFANSKSYSNMVRLKDFLETAYVRF